MDECSVFDLPDIALGKIITHLNFRDKVALSAASKAGQEVFNAPDTVVKWGAIWGRLRIAVTTRGVEVHCPIDPDYKEHFVAISTENLKQWLTSRGRGAGFHTLDIAWEAPGSRAAGMYYAIPEILLSLPNASVVHVTATVSFPPHVQVTMISAAKHLPSLQTISVHINESDLGLVAADDRFWAELPARCVRFAMNGMPGARPHPIIEFPNLQPMAKSLRTLTLKSLGSAWDQDPFWLQLATLTNLISLEIEFASPSPLEPLEFAPQPRRNASIPCQPLPDLHVAKVRGMSNTTWRALGVVRNAAHVLLMQCRVGAGDVEGLLPNAEWLDGGGTSSQTTPTKPRVLVNSRVKTLVVQLLVDYAPVMWRHLAHCPALQRLSIQCPSTMNTSNMQDTRGELMALSSLHQLELINFPNMALHSLPNMPSLAYIHLAPSRSNYNQPMLPWIERYTSLRALRYTCMAGRDALPPREHQGDVRSGAFGQQDVGRAFRLPNLETASFVHAVPSMAPEIARLTALTSLKGHCHLPQSWSMLQSLRCLHTNGLLVPSLPSAALSHMTSLTSLVVCDSGTKFIGANLYMLQNLSILKLHNIKLKQWPQNWSQLTSLKHLELIMNRMKEPPLGVTVPVVLKSLTSMQQLRSVVLPQAEVSGRTGDSRAERAKAAGISLFNSSMQGAAELLKEEHGVAAGVHDPGVQMNLAGFRIKEVMPEMEEQDEGTDDTKELVHEVLRACWTGTAEMPTTTRLDSYLRQMTDEQLDNEAFIAMLMPLG